MIDRLVHTQIIIARNCIKLHYFTKRCWHQIIFLCVFFSNVQVQIDRQDIFVISGGGRLCVFIESRSRSRDVGWKQCKWQWWGKCYHDDVKLQKVFVFGDIKIFMRIFEWPSRKVMTRGNEKKEKTLFWNVRLTKKEEFCSCMRFGNLFCSAVTYCSPLLDGKNLVDQMYLYCQRLLLYSLYI